MDKLSADTGLEQGGGHLTQPVRRKEKDGEIQKIVSVSGENTIGFLRTVFRCYEEGHTVAITNGHDNLNNFDVHQRSLNIQQSGEQGWIKLAHRPKLSDAIAQIIFTSGTEGHSKPVVLSHRNLADVVFRLHDVMGLNSEVREYVGAPVTHSFGLGRARAVAAAGGQLYLPKIFNPLEIRHLLDTNQINAISAVPSLWQVILDRPNLLGSNVAKVRWIEIGSQFMSIDHKRKMVELFPRARIVQHFGLTEASRTTFLNLREAGEDVLGSVGRSVGDVALRITEGGAIAVRGPHVACGLLQHNGSILPLVDSEGWFVTKDCGTLTDGVLHYHGRMDNQINIAGKKLSAEMLESAIFAQIPALSGHLAVTAFPDRMRGEIVLLALEDQAADFADLVRIILTDVFASHGILSRGALKIVICSILPRTATNKIQRRRLIDFT